MIKRLLRAREAVLLAAIVALTLIIALRFPAFIAPRNLANVFNDTSPLMILAIGQMIVILTKCIDLSVAATLALVGMVVSLLNIAVPDLPLVLTLLLAVGLGACLGMFNGILVWKLKIPPIVVTLGTMTIYRGIIFLISNGKWVNAHEMSSAFKALPREVFLGFPLLSWFALAVILTCEIVRRSGGHPLRQSTGDTCTLFHKVWGSDRLWQALRSGVPADRIIAGFQGYARSFAASRKPYLIYS